MLLENFYKIIHIKEREDGKQAIEIELNPGHVLYQGHFPGQPVVPGVCTCLLYTSPSPRDCS